MAISKQASVIRSAIVFLMGGRCVDCGSKRKLEFSHIRPTSLSGASRGSTTRILDVCRNVTSYRLRCKRCHVRFDKWSRNSAAKQTANVLRAPSYATVCRYHQTTIERCHCSPFVQELEA